MTEFFKNGDRMGIKTDAPDESRFYEQVSKLIHEFIEAKSFDHDWEFQFSYWLPMITEMACKYRGYKTSVKEETILSVGYTGGDDAPCIGSVNSSGVGTVISCLSDDELEESGFISTNQSSSPG